MSKNLSTLKTIFIQLVFLLFSFTYLGAEDIMLLGAGSKWKQAFVMFPPAVSEASAKTAGKATDLAARQGMLKKRIKQGLVTKDLPSNWMQVDFDDSGWINRAGLTFVNGDHRVTLRSSLAYIRGVDYFPAEMGLLALRGTFTVIDPKKINSLICNLSFRGGYVLYLNGKEIKREFLPAGKISQQTPSSDYDLNAFIAKSKRGRLGALAFYTHATDAHKPFWEKRERKSKAISIDIALLKKGVNHIALEIHRSEYPIECKSKKNMTKRGKLAFGTVGLAEFSLKADTVKENVISGTERPAGFQLWNANACDIVRTTDYGNPSDAIHPIKIAAASNGQFHGQVVLSSTKEIKGLKVELSDLKSINGTIVKTALQVRYGAINPTHTNLGNKRDNGYGGKRYDLLLSNAPKALPFAKVTLKDYQINYRKNLGLKPNITPACAVPIWIFVKTTKANKAGNYIGSLKISASGMKTVTVPLEIHVAAFNLPDMKDFVAPLNLWQSPDSLAKFYQVEMWSEKHWALIDASLKLMGEMGNIALQFPLFAESALGNPHSMIRWKKIGEGKYEYDFSIFDRYLKTALKYHSKERLKILSLRVWGYEVAVNPKTKVRADGAKVSLVDKSGKLSLMNLPKIFESKEVEALLTPLLRQTRDRIKALGLEKLICYGNGGDRSPLAEQVAMLDRILPGTPWVRDSHFPAKGVGGAKVRATTLVWGGTIPNPKKKRLYGWDFKPDYMAMNFNRAGTECLRLNGSPSPWSFRMWMESTLTCGRNGNGRVGLDFFKFKMDYKKLWGGERPKSEVYGGSGGTLFGSYPSSSVYQIGLGNSTTDLVAPGPKGPVTTARFENARSGNQEAEARIIIEKALVAGKLPAALSKKCQEFLDERTNALRMWALNNGAISWGQLNWFQSTLNLYTLAGEVNNAKK
ncbi:MAG: hypothetical protein COA79_16050 [Planctomycetota bacterium]|nr:MAG: hypothetical protein COA79_16050 [Planctomycetota bacterium]